MNWWAMLSFLFIGISLGMFIQTLLLTPKIGDDYEITKPKIKGKDNNMKINQKNIVDKLKNKLRKNTKNEEKNN